MTIESLTERMTVRDILRARIWQEVRDYNLRSDGVFRGLVQPSALEQRLNDSPAKERKQINWEEQFTKACEAFERNGFFVLIGDRQAESLDEAFTVTVELEVQFVKLVPLIGG